MPRDAGAVLAIYDRHRGAVVAGLAKADVATHERIRAEVIELANRSMRDGNVQMRGTANVIVGTR